MFTARCCAKSCFSMLIFLGACHFSAPSSSAQRPCVHFDVPELVAVRISEDEALQRDYPDDLLVSATFDVSSLIRVGRESDLSQYLYVIESPNRTLSVADYSPKTELVTSLAGNVGVQKHSESSANLGINGSLPQPNVVAANGSASLGKSKGTKFSYELLPPKRTLSASGTISRGTAVYYKLRASQQTSMDGVKRFVVVFRAPSHWRGDYVRLRCAAYQRGGDGKEQPICGSSDFLVGLYRVGDETARARVHALTRADRRLRELARNSHETIDRQRYPSMTDKLGSIFNVSRPRIPRDWFSRSIRNDRPEGFERHLPGELRDALRDYRKARQSVRELTESKELASVAS